MRQEPAKHLRTGEVSDADLQKLETFVVLMYDRSSASTGVDEARVDLIGRKQRAYDAVPPSRAALTEHAYQAGIIWGQAIVTNLEIGSPANWGWTHTGETWQICWTIILPIVRQAVRS